MSKYRDAGRTRWRIRVNMHGRFFVIASGTSDEALATAYDAMLTGLVQRGLTATVEDIANRRVPLSLVYEEVSERGFTGLPARLADRLTQRDLRPDVERWAAELRRRGAPIESTIAAYVRGVHRLLGSPGPVTARDVNAATVNARLAGLPSARKAAVGFRLFWRWALRQGTVTDRGLLADIESPPNGKPRDRWLTEARMHELLAHVPEKYRDGLTLAYATGIESSVLLGLTVEDVDPVRRLIFAKGTKTKARKRQVQVASFAWDALARMLATAPERRGYLLPRVRRERLSAVHRAAAEAIGEHGLTLHDARHSWAVRLLRAGTPVAVVAAQAGHANGVLILSTYGLHIPSAADLGSWEQVATAHGAG